MAETVAKICRACIMGPLGVLGVLYVMYLVSVNVTATILSTKIHPKNAERGYRNIFYIILPSSPPSIGEVDFCAQNYCCRLGRY
jgi:hypothetical protein